MKTIISLTSIPSRFNTLPAIVEKLAQQKNIDEIWVNIPHSYRRFPDVEVVIPAELSVINPRVIVNRCDDDGPGTMYIAPSVKSDADLIIVVNDDTNYPDNLSTELIGAYEKDNACWCLSGFCIGEYTKRNNLRAHDKLVDVTESYGGVILRRDWILKILPEFRELYKLTYNDDVIVGNLFEKHGIKKKMIFTEKLNLGMIGQYSFGMGPDALFQNNGEGTHYDNNLRIFKKFKENDVYYFKDYSTM
jgi:hypothetical protein